MNFRKSPIAVAAFALFGALPLAAQAQSTATPAPSSGALDVWFKAPAANATIKGVLNGGTSCYTNSSGPVARVVYSMDGKALNTDSTPSDGTQCVLDTTKFANGTHQLRADAYDASGNRKTDVRNVNIQNSTTTSTSTSTSTGTTGTGTTSTGTTSTGTTTGTTTTTGSTTTTPSYAGTPYSGSAVMAPATFPAANFDKGGEGVAYHDLSAGNLGGQYRTSETVDIYPSTDTASGPYQVANFQTGEWMNYTVNVPTSGNYDIGIRAANNSAVGRFHIEVDGVNVTGALSVPSTGNWTAFQWFGKTGVPLTAGSHVIKLVAEQQWFNVSALRVLASATTTTTTGGSTTGTTTGGTTTGTTTGGTTTGGTTTGGTTTGTTTGGTTTTTATATPAPSAGNLDVWFKAPVAGTTIKGVLSGGTSCYTNSSGPVQRVVYTIDGTALNTDSTPTDGTQCVLDTTKVANGTHQLKAVAYDASGNAMSDVISVNVQNAISSTTTGSTSTGSTSTGTTTGTTTGSTTGSTSTGSTTGSTSGATATKPANMLFWSGFEGAMSFTTPSNCYNNGCFQQLVGTDSSTGYAWPFKLMNGDNQFQLLSNSGSTPSAGSIGNYMFNEIRQVTGHKGTTTNAMYSEVRQSGCCGTNSQGGGSTQDAFHLLPASDPGDLYISKWIMLQPDMVDRMRGGDAWRVVFEWKEGNATGGAFRTVLGITAYNGAAPSWQITWDNDANGGLPLQQFYRTNNTSIPVPIGQWFKLEVFWHRSTGSDGRIWYAVNGQVIDDHRGTTIGVRNDPVGRIFLNQVYSGSTYPIYQWVDDIQVWRGFPTAQQGDAWYDPPYAPH